MPLLYKFGIVAFILALLAFYFMAKQYSIMQTHTRHMDLRSYLHAGLVRRRWGRVGKILLLFAVGTLLHFVITY